MAGGYARERLTVGNTVKALTAATYVGANSAYITVETDAIRFTLDGTDPVASSKGHLVAAGDSIQLMTPAEIALFKAIRQTTDAVIEVTYRP